MHFFTLETVRRIARVRDEYFQCYVNAWVAVVKCNLYETSFPSQIVTWVSGRPVGPEGARAKETPSPLLTLKNTQVTHNATASRDSTQFTKLIPHHSVVPVFSQFLEQWHYVTISSRRFLLRNVVLFNTFKSIPIVNWLWLQWYSGGVFCATWRTDRLKSDRTRCWSWKSPLPADMSELFYLYH